MVALSMARITTERGTQIETLEFMGHSTPWAIDGYVHLHLVVTGVGQRPVHCEPMLLQKAEYDKLYYELSEDDFWEDVGAQALDFQRTIEEHRADPSKWSNRAV
jgi:hypothetical protein